jgi:hypothetical protein
MARALQKAPYLGSGLAAASAAMWTLVAPNTSSAPTRENPALKAVCTYSFEGKKVSSTPLVRLYGSYIKRVFDLTCICIINILLGYCQNLLSRVCIQRFSVRKLAGLLQPRWFAKETRTRSKKTAALHELDRKKGNTRCSHKKQLAADLNRITHRTPR